MTVLVEKSSKAKARQRRVAEEYARWLKKNPKVSRKRKIAQFNAISDSAFLEQVVKRNG